MTDKVQKICEEVARIQLYTQSGVLKQILDYIDKVQEEPVTSDFEAALAKEWKGYNDRGAAKVDALEDNTQELAFAKGFYRGWHYNKEKSASEELEEASKEWLRPQLDKSYANYGKAKMMELTHFDGYAMLDAIEFGAKWQKAKDESTTENLGEYINELSKQFPEVSFAKLSRIAVRVAKWQKKQDQSTIELAEDHAMLAGMNKMEEEMMEKAIDAELYSDGMFIPLIGVKDREKVSDIKFGDKVKVIVIKED